MKSFRSKIYTILTLVMVILLPKLKAQNIDNLMYEAYLTHSEILWNKAVEKAEENSPEKAKAYYGLLNTAIAQKNEELFDTHLDHALKLLEKLEKTDDFKAESLALRSSIYGFIMAFSPMMGMTYGPKSSRAVENALKLEKESGIVWMVRASSLLYTPEMFGGDKLEAEKAFQKSIRSFEEKEQTKNNWMYLNTLAGLGQAYLANGKKEAAIATYQKALQIEPDFHWVGKVLLPTARKS